MPDIPEEKKEEEKPKFWIDAYGGTTVVTASGTIYYPKGDEVGYSMDD